MNRSGVIFMDCHEIIVAVMPFRGLILSLDRVLVSCPGGSRDDIRMEAPIHY